MVGVQSEALFGHSVLTVGVQSEALFGYSVLSVGVQSEALFGLAKLRFELRTPINPSKTEQSFALNSNEPVKS
jgi:hypothetical protein